MFRRSSFASLPRPGLGRDAFALALVGAALIGTPRAQLGSQAVPARATGVEGANVETFLLGGFAGKTQMVVARGQLGPLLGQPIRRIIVRRDAQTNDAMPGGMKGGWIDLEIRASWTSASLNSLSTSFAKNHAHTPIVVYRGAYHVTDSPHLSAGTRVASLIPSVSAHIVLQRQIPPSKTGNLCLEFIHRPHATKAAPESWFADAMDASTGAATTFGRSCWRAGHADVQSNGIADRALLGGTLVCTTDGPTGRLALLTIGASNQQWGKNKLPFDLAGLGAPGCFVYASQDFSVGRVVGALQNFPTGAAQWELPLPKDAGLVGARVYTQWFFFDPTANALSLTATNGASTTIGAMPKLGVALVRSQDPNASTGRRDTGFAPVLVLAAK